MEEGNSEDVYEPSVKVEPEDILSPPMEFIVCPENQISEEDEWVSRSSEQLSTDPLATNPMCEIGNGSFTTDPLIKDMSSESCEISGGVDLSKSVIHSEEDLGVCRVDVEMAGTSQKTEVPQPSVNGIMNLPPVFADPDPEETRRLLDDALQKIIIQVTKRTGRKRRASQLQNGEIKQQNKSSFEFSSPLTTQQMKDCLSPPLDPKPKISKTTRTKPKTIPKTVGNMPSNEQCQLSHLSTDLLSSVESSTVNRMDMVPMQGDNFLQPPAKKPRKGAKSFQQRLQENFSKLTSPKSVGSGAVLSTNLSPPSVPVISDVRSLGALNGSPFRATGGDPSPAGGSSDAAGANAAAEGAQEAADSRILKTPHRKRFNAKQVSQEATPQTLIDATIHKDPAVNLSEEKQIVTPPSRSARSPRKQNSSRRPLPDRPTPICNLCGRGFSTYCELTSHMRLHTASARRFFCSSCKSRFGHAEALRSHARKRHGIEILAHSPSWQRPFAYSCNSCDKYYGYRADLNKHLLDFHGAARSKVASGVATALIGMTRMRGAIPKEYSDSDSRSSVLKTSPFSENQSQPLPNSTVNSDQETELNPDSCFQESCPPSVPSYHRKLSVSGSPEFRNGPSSPISVRSGSMPSGILSASSSSSESEGVSSHFRKYEFEYCKTQEMQRSKTTSRHDCPVHSKTSSSTIIRSVKNSKYSSSTAAQLTSKSTVTKKAFDVKFSDVPKYNHPQKRNSSNTGRGNNSYSQANKSYVESKANHLPQVTREEFNITGKKFYSRGKIPCPVHKSSRETVKDFDHVLCSKKTVFSKSGHVTPSSFRKPLPESRFSLSCEENVVPPPDSDCESVGSSVTSISKPNLPKKVQRAESRVSNLNPHPKMVYYCDRKSLVSSSSSISKPNLPKNVQRAVSLTSNLMNSNCLEISENINKKRHSFPSDSSLTSTNPKLQKIHTTSAGNISKCKNPTHNKMTRRPYANGNTFVSPTPKTCNRTYASSKPTSEKRNSFPPHTSLCVDMKIQKNHTISVNKSSANRRIVESENIEISSHSHISSAVNGKKVNGFPNFNSSISSTQYNQSNYPSYSSQTAYYDSNFRANSKKKVSHPPIPMCGTPLVVLKRINPLMLKKSQ